MDPLYLHDGDKLRDEVINLLASYLLTSKDNFFIKKGEWKVNFVGFIELKIGQNNINNEKEYINVKIYSYPKHYRVTDKEKDMKSVLQSIALSQNKIIGIDNQNKINISSRILNLLNVLKYYKQKGLYSEREKKSYKGFAKNINFEKTINKVVPLYNNNNYIYSNFINNKKEKNYTIVTDCMVYMLTEETKKYNFYFEEYPIEYLYNKNLFENLEYIIAILKKELSNTYNDHDIFLIRNMLEYFQNKTKAKSNDLLLCTSNYELIWEKIVAAMLDFTFEHQKRFNISDDGKEIKIDHFSFKGNKIYDSKYYKTSDFNERDNRDYKQIFYGYHLTSNFSKAYEGKKNLHFKEYNKWENALIKPHNESKGGTYLIERNNYDGLNIKEYFIDCKKAVNYYIGNSILNPLDEVMYLKNKMEEAEQFEE